MAGTTTDADLYCEVVQYYARQMPLMEEGRIEEYAATFTEDGVFEHAMGWRLAGREQLVEGTRTGVARYAGKAMRHWYDRITVTAAEDGEVHCGYLAMVSLVDAEGRVSFEPSCTVRDVLVRRDGELLTRYRFIRHDTADPTRIWEGRLAEQT
ncbi:MULTISPECIES: nuclear transport factor 2 family protein [Streptomyces]|nr:MULTISPECIES: nuclear transport factor 2 family protein [Streptomyces]KNE82215.1 hypothetical protein ADZ36_11935 [Streptomyces fradiae]MZE81553.1 nuclear transport factor 2 family protein [Streptomyces sp. SID5475]OFA56482.1 hypothetical protein BEN35_05860 [Streptomyces fradiae]